MATYRILHGCHSQDGKLYRQNDTVTTDIDLEARFNSPGSIKFIKVAGTKKEQEAKEEAKPKNKLESMTVNELREFAESEEIELPDDLTKKKEIIDWIQASI